MSDPISVDSIESQQPVADHVLMAVFWIFCNHIGAVLISFFSFVFLYAVDLEAVAKVQIGMLAALVFSATLLQYASTKDGQRFWSWPTKQIANREMLWMLAICWPAILLFQALCAAFFLTGSFQAQFSPIPPPVSQILNWTIVIFVVFIVPVAEECFFRQHLWEKIEHTSGPMKAFVWSASLFWLMHLPNIFFGGVSKATVLNFLSLLPLTLALSWLRLRCGSARASIVLHVLHNFLSISPSHVLRLFV